MFRADGVCSKDSTDEESLVVRVDEKGKQAITVHETSKVV